MGFLNQVMLWGTLGIGVPILIHLLNRFRHKEIEWGAMELLRRATVVRSRRIQFEDLILLLLRCLAILLLALAMARPTISSGGVKLLGGESRVGMVIAVDASFSMSHRPGVTSRFETAMQRVRQIVRTLQPGDQVSLVRMGQRPRILMRNVSYDEKQVEDLLKKADVLSERLNLELCLEELSTLIGEVKAPVRECYLITDAQQSTFREFSDRAQKSLQEIRAAGKLYWMSVATGAAENLALTDFTMTSGMLRKGGLVRYVAAVTNHGRREKRNVAVTLYVNEKTADRRVVDRVRPGQTEVVPLFARLKTAGNVKLSAGLDRDPLTADDVRYSVAHVYERVRVLCVDGDPSRDPYKTETFYLQKALVPSLRKLERPSIALKAISYVELGKQKLSEFDVVILANLPDIHAAQAKALYNFVYGGGGLMIFLGDRVNPKLLNLKTRAVEDGRPDLLPGEIDKVIEAPKSVGAGWPIEAMDASHPLGRFLKRLPERLVHEGRVTSLYGVKLAPGAHTILQTVAGTPLLIERRLGMGNVLLYTGSADRAWGSIVLNPAFPMLIQESMNHLTRRSHERPFAVAEPLVVAMPREAIGREMRLVNPDGQATPIQLAESEGRGLAECGLPEMAGFYELQYGGEDGPLRTLQMAVNVEPAESDVKEMNPEKLQANFESVGAQMLPGEGLAEAIGQGRTGLELWRWLMLAAMLLLALEVFLAHVFSRRLDVRLSALPSSARDDVVGAARAA